MIFIDTGAFIARYIQADQHHAQSVRVWKKLERSSSHLLTSNFVLDETFTLLGRWANYTFAAEKAHLIYASSRIEIVRPDEQIELEALELFEKFADQKVSFSDCISFALMKKRKVKQVFTFDEHFSRAGFATFH
jgi:predicted nucleic acid-binding protein